MGDLELTTSTSKQHYRINDDPALSLVVTDVGRNPCVQNLADREVILSVYNGSARVWGSHDCKIEQGSDDRTLMPNEPVSVTIGWTGLSSEPNCAGTRQRVGAGSYTLYATLSDRQAKTSTFTIG